MFHYYLFVSLTFVIVLLSDKRFAEAECRNDTDCSKLSQASPFCCKSFFKVWAPHECYPSCAGKACYSDIDCGGTGGECCNTVNTGKFGNCTTNKNCLKKCYSNSDCKGGTYCCKGVGIVPSVCLSSCVGRACNDNSFCGAPNECCRSGVECEKCHGFSLPGWLIAVIASVGVLLVIGLAIVIYCLCVTRRSSAGRPLLSSGGNKSI